MKKILLLVVVVLIISSIGVYFLISSKKEIVNPLARLVPTPLLAYSFPNLRKTQIPVSQITLGRKVSETEDSFSQMFYYKTPEKPGSKKMKTVSGLANFPKEPGNYPVIVMYRGFIPSDQFVSGAGSQPSARVFSANGLITLAPDFLGFGESDDFSKDSFENRFQTYTTAVSLLKSLPTINDGLAASYSGTLTADTSKIGIWGHSNGGHIALAALAITGADYPTVLWAPVSKSFPYSILYYTDESDDQGKILRKLLAQFEQVYNINLFSPERYYKWIKSPIEINQGENDEEVPVWWSDDLAEKLKKQGNDVTYFTYPNSNHNLQPDGWSEAVTRSYEFFKEKFEE